MLDSINAVLDKYVRPYLSEHGGDISVLSFENGVLTVKLTGECSNCPSARFTMEDIVVKEIKERIPQVEKVELETGVSDDMLDFAKKILNHKLN